MEEEAEEERRDRRDDQRREEARELGITLFAHPACVDVGSWGWEKWWVAEE